jgi:hypothetical protein
MRQVPARSGHQQASCAPARSAARGGSDRISRTEEPVAIQAPVLGAALLTATMASITGGAGPLSFVLGIVVGCSWC